MSTEVAKRPADVASRRPASFAPQTLAEAMEFAKLIANTDFVPKEYRGRVADIIVCIQFGAEIGLSPLQALHSVAMINGKPSVWGDGALALVQASGLLLDHKEDVEGDGDERFGWCVMVRKDRDSPYRKKFSVRQSKDAGLWGRNVWKGYPDVMLVARARSACMRAAFPDVLKGVIPREEAIDYPPEDEQVEDKPKSDLPTAERESVVQARAKASRPMVDLETGEMVHATADADLESTLAASLEVAEGAAPIAQPLSVANLPDASEVVSEDGAAPSPPNEIHVEFDLDEPVLINNADRRMFHACREAGQHSKEATKDWLQMKYGISSTAEIQRDWFHEICRRLRDPMPLS